MKGHQIAARDTARALHISPPTISRSSADHPGVSQETENMVNAYAHEHKYKFNALALSLRTNSMKTIGVTLPQTIHYFFSSVLSGIKGGTKEGGYYVIICQSNENYEKEVKGAQALLEARVCGILASVARATTVYNHFQELVDSDIPMVFSDRICTGILIDRVVVNDCAGVCSAVKYLIRNGCRRIVFFGSPSHLAISNNRKMGYEDTLRKNGLPVDKELIKTYDNYAEALRLTPESLPLPNRPDAFFAVSDETAIGALNIIKAEGLRISDEASICGFTNDSLAEVSDPLLTSANRHDYELGAIVVRLLIERLSSVRDEDHIISRIIKTNLAVKQSTC